MSLAPGRTTNSGGQLSARRAEPAELARYERKVRVVDSSSRSLAIRSCGAQLTLFLYGDGDVRAPLDVAEALRTAIPGSTLVVLAGAGHVSNLDDPQHFNQALRTFFRAH